MFGLARLLHTVTMLPSLESFIPTILAVLMIFPAWNRFVLEPGRCEPPRFALQPPRCLPVRRRSAFPGA